MDEILLLNAVILTVVLGLWVFVWIEKGRKEEGLMQLDEAFGRVAVELLERTKHLPDLESLMPKITLKNENPLAALASFISTLRGDTIPEDNFTDFQPGGDEVEARRIVMYGEENSEAESGREVEGSE